jgi:ubiquinone/menaquinone biosynthesis C-methylase UbiE
LLPAGFCITVANRSTLPINEGKEIDMTLTHTQARNFYDHFGKKQDAQSFYEDDALEELIAHAGLSQAQNIFELGCGTGRFAARLLAEHLPDTANYLGMDVSQTMVDLAQQALGLYADRAKAVLSGGAMNFPLPDHSADRIISTYVLDLLSEADIHAALAEAHRVLKVDGKLCLASLGTGETPVSKMVAGVWGALCKLYAPMVGGCRPLRLTDYVDPQAWQIDYRKVISQFGVPSEVLIATPRPIISH